LEKRGCNVKETAPNGKDQRGATVSVRYIWISAMRQESDGTWEVRIKTCNVKKAAAIRFRNPIYVFERMKFRIYDKIISCSNETAYPFILMRYLFILIHNDDKRVA
jgi:hypothetical protein